ncbi:hypothetical protein HZA39_02435 [Candidatus Peregrinibacteria bacterium]|nr:hypothetical protein [Candidatus Peregrinibacteria bacterium]
MRIHCLGCHASQCIFAHAQRCFPRIIVIIVI